MDTDTAAVTFGASIGSATTPHVMRLGGSRPAFLILAALSKDACVSRSTILETRAASPMFSLSPSLFSATACKIKFAIPGLWRLKSSHEDRGVLVDAAPAALESLENCEGPGRVRVHPLPAFTCQSSKRVELSKIVFECEYVPIAIMAAPPMSRLSSSQLASGPSVYHRISQSDESGSVNSWEIELGLSCEGPWKIRILFQRHDSSIAQLDLDIDVRPRTLKNRISIAFTIA
jgi:hypothetical protein